MVTVFLILINIIFYFTVPYNYYSLFGLNILFFKKDAFWQIASALFLHANLTHLILNMIVLFQFGKILENCLGSFKFCLLYITGGLLCSFLSACYIYFIFLTSNEFVNVVGASGVICVLMGYYAVLDANSLKGLFIVVMLMSFVPLLMGINVAWYAHIFGFICGFILAKLKEKR
ncbi:rhomboid family intramembrane serine protease [Campylobacter sp. MIT 21-1685]|uniref:rhomboid family intramembrane serine protease n=1 Tax=unclassified Campylobacter TaxID=2593542 RepID=UPI00224B18BF|nr:MULTISPECIES: rhomboid family intramembrane serine protease [unclassified Campylobacter]MCX2682941.1 rhomboid family intramembrane serine protease [Campylobacter sp. MIT 21-1684]MCX2751223.1 rhomboid family intramembrane serine protease [Campylobacter sp. MIT 21-1682]MCX2807422.1 rhomboid family intramembrane serine protease [Campylobacter sp. MIT 21-1685]